MPHQIDSGGTISGGPVPWPRGRVVKGRGRSGGLVVGRVGDDGSILGWGPRPSTGRAARGPEPQRLDITGNGAGRDVQVHGDQRLQARLAAPAVPEVEDLPASELRPKPAHRLCRARPHALCQGVLRGSRGEAIVAPAGEEVGSMRAVLVVVITSITSISRGRRLPNHPKDEACRWTLHGRGEPWDRLRGQVALGSFGCFGWLRRGVSPANLACYALPPSTACMVYVSRVCPSRR
jgi:hypothetical protein